MIAAVVFDLDGTLIDSEPLWEQVRHQLTVTHGGRWPHDAQARMMGMRTDEWAHYLHDELGVTVAPAEIADEAIKAVEDRYGQHLPLLPGAKAAVERLAARWPLGLASSSPRQLIDVALALSGLAPCFAAVISTDEVGAGKPAPDVYRAAADRLGIGPSDGVAVEDSTNGVRAAVNAGLACVAVPRARFPVEPGALAVASAVLPNLDGLTVELVDSLDRAGG